MRISTAEIKILIKECVKSYGMYTTADFKDYINKNSGKDVTRGQISGAISQLIDAKEIVRVGRGIYSKDSQFSMTRNIKKDSEIDGRLKTEIYDTLDRIEKELANTIGSINIWDLNGSHFEIIAKIRKLKDSIEEIKSECK